MFACRRCSLLAVQQTCLGGLHYQCLRDLPISQSSIPCAMRHPNHYFPTAFRPARFLRGMARCSIWPAPATLRPGRALRDDRPFRVQTPPQQPDWRTRTNALRAIPRYCGGNQGTRRKTPGRSPSPETHSHPRCAQGGRPPPSRYRRRLRNGCTSHGSGYRNGNRNGLPHWARGCAKPPRDPTTRSNCDTRWRGTR